MCCAFCGPDPELTGEQITTRFLDFSRIYDDEYEHEALMISIKWFSNILEEKTNSAMTTESKRLPSGLKWD